MQNMSQCHAQDSQAIDQVIKLLESVKQGKLVPVKPEPREWEVGVDGSGYISSYSRYPNQQIKVREVL